MRYPGLICTALIVVILAVYLQVGNHQFFSFDDYAYVTRNPHVSNGLTGDNILWAFTSVEATNWHPVTWLSHMADAQCFGLDPRGHHLTSVVIHALSSVLLLLLLFRLTGALWQSSFVAFLFALHPLHVESVAWVAERKDVLSAFFWFLTLFAYARYLEKPKASRYLAALTCFLVGLMCKPMLVTLPLILLLVDFWPLERYRPTAGEPWQHQLRTRLPPLLKEKIPFFAGSLLSAAITIYAQRSGGAVVGLDAMPLRLRVDNALIAYVRYLGKIFWPHDLAVFYPFPASLPLWQAIGSLFILLLVSAAAIRSARQRPYLAVGWFWYLCTLIPVIGLLQVGAQSMADRYTYIPSIGIFIMVAWGVPELAQGLRHRKRLLALGAAALIITSAALSFQQLGYWRDTISLYRHTLQVTRDNFMVHYSLGVALADAGDIDAGIREYREVLRISPNYRDAHTKLGFALASKGELGAATGEFRQALRLNPEDPDAHANLGIALSQTGDLDDAIREFQEALRLSPGDATAQSNLKFALNRRRMQDGLR
jgi:tetratricopeptide (TPR) repeat protein